MEDERQPSPALLQWLKEARVNTGEYATPGKRHLKEMATKLEETDS